MDRGKVMTEAELEAGRDFGRYLDVDGDGIAYRTYPGTHPTKGSFFTRGTTKDRYARYTEDGVAYVDNMQRLQRKFETAKALVPAPEIRKAGKPTRSGIVWFGSTSAAMAESLAALELEGIYLDRMRLRGFPFADAVADFIAAHDRVFVVEQNRDAQMKALLVNECGIDPSRLDLGAALRRHAGHGALHHPRDHGKGAAVQRHAAAQGRAVACGRTIGRVSAFSDA